ncbi:hypothetical protein GGI20_000256 [Coemansia sp. BCRC 34301]|nr:hypothetical protein GGI20_000256 [Coemansia sp. BCRC 34301]
MDSQDDIAVYQAFDTYDFEHDEVFQAGLQSIESGRNNPKVMEKAKTFYYSRRFASIDFEKYTAWKLADSATASSNSNHIAADETTDQQALPPIPFAKVVDMIRRGETIPGIRKIPDEINSHVPSTSTSVAPRKPWEQ